MMVLSLLLGIGVYTVSWHFLYFFDHSNGRWRWKLLFLSLTNYFFTLMCRFSALAFAMFRPLVNFPQILLLGLTRRKMENKVTKTSRDFYQIWLFPFGAYKLYDNFLFLVCVVRRQFRIEKSSRWNWLQ